MLQTTYQAFRASLIKAGYFPLREEPFLQGYLAVQDLEPEAEQVSAILFDGPPGTGKTYFAETLTGVIGAQLLRHQFTPDARSEELLYDLHLLRIIQGMAGVSVPTDIRDLTNPGILIRALKASLEGPVVLLLDEMDKALPAVDTFLLGFLQDRAIYHAQYGDQIGNPANLIVVVTKNDLRSLDDALMRRLRRVYLDYPHPEQERDLILKKLPEFPQEAAVTLVTLANRLRAAKAKARKVPSTPELIRCARDLLRAPSGQEGQVVLQWLIAFPEDRPLLKETEKELAGLFKYVRGR